MFMFWILLIYPKNHKWYALVIFILHLNVGLYYFNDGNYLCFRMPEKRLNKYLKMASKLATSPKAKHKWKSIVKPQIEKSLQCIDSKISFFVEFTVPKSSVCIPLNSCEKDY